MINFLAIFRIQHDVFKLATFLLCRLRNCIYGSTEAEALVVGNRLLSSYKTEAGVKFWIITEWDRSLTTVLLPEDY